MVHCFPIIRMSTKEIASALFIILLPQLRVLFQIIKTDSNAASQGERSVG